MRRAAAPSRRDDRSGCRARLTGSAPDLVATVPGTGSGRLLLLGHVDTVIAPRLARAAAARRRPAVRPRHCRHEGRSGARRSGVARALAERPETFAELAVAARHRRGVAHALRSSTPSGLPAMTRACASRPGSSTPTGDEAVIVRRKAAGTMRVGANGRAAHSGSAPDQGRNALLALAAHRDRASPRHHDPDGPRAAQRRADGDALGRCVQRRAGRRASCCSTCAPTELEAFDGGAARRCRPSSTASTLEAEMERRVARDGLARGDPRAARARRARGSGGRSSASRAAAPATPATSPPPIPLTVDGLGPRGGGAHTPEEFVLAPSLRERAEVALAVALEVLDMHS